jgi:hypothetical protein
MNLYRWKESQEGFFTQMQKLVIDARKKSVQLAFGVNRRKQIDKVIQQYCTCMVSMRGIAGNAVQTVKSIRVGKRNFRSEDNLSLDLEQLN